MNASTDVAGTPASAAAQAEIPLQLTPGAERIMASAAFQTLRARRSRLAWTLTIAMLVIYYGFILLIAFSPETLAVKTGTGAMSLGLPVGLGVILSAIILTGIYVWRANRDFDGLNEQALRSAQ